MQGERHTVVDLCRVRGVRLLTGAGVRCVLLQTPDMLSPSREEPRARSSTVSEGQLPGDHKAVQEVAALEAALTYALLLVLLPWCPQPLPSYTGAVTLVLPACALIPIL